MWLVRGDTWLLQCISLALVFSCTYLVPSFYLCLFSVLHSISGITLGVHCLYAPLGYMPGFGNCAYLVLCIPSQVYPWGCNTCMTPLAISLSLASSAWNSNEDSDPSSSTPSIINLKLLTIYLFFVNMGLPTFVWVITPRGKKSGWHV